MPSISQLRRQVTDKRAGLRSAIEALQGATGASLVPMAPELPSALMSNCRLLSSRFSIVELMPKAAICAEIGVRAGHFTKAILTIARPDRLHLFESDFSDFDHAAFAQARARGGVTLYEGDPAVRLSDLPDHHLDWIYLGGDRSYRAISDVLSVASRKTKPYGFIVCNDYSVWSPVDVIESGVLRAVHEFCLRDTWELVYLGLHGQGCHDICLRRRC